MLTRKLLEQEGFDVDEAHDGAQARIISHPKEQDIASLPKHCCS